ncbi:ATP-binding protein [Streptomyces sp. NPDC005480]|uniref:ATP-binding protein n=1 Tax=Streptomyces sp. NPDC005480 TaxID=3154880 RepID=UPI00339E479E
MGTAAFADEVLAPSGPLRPLLNGPGTRPLPDLCDAIAHALPDGNRAGETLMLLARTKALPKDRVLTLSLPAGPEAAPIARAAARRQLEAWGVDEETAFTTELIVSELVGNAVRYGTPPLQLRLIFERMLTCEVSDTATSAPQVKHARTIDETGRGLFIIASLADQWGTRFQTQGKTVWAGRTLDRVLTRALLRRGIRGGAGHGGFGLSPTTHQRTLSSRSAKTAAEAGFCPVKRVRSTTV